MPFPAQDDKTNKRKVGSTILESQSKLKRLHAIKIPKVRFPLPAAKEMELVTKLRHCWCLSTCVIGEALRYAVMVAPDSESAAYMTENIHDGICTAFPEMIDADWVDPAVAATNIDDEPKETGDGKADVPIDLKKLAWASCDTNANDNNVSNPAAHRWAHVKLPTTNQNSKKKWYAIASGRNLPWSPGIYALWPNCHRHTSGAKNVKFFGFNSQENATRIKWFWLHSGGQEPRFVPLGEDPCPGTFVGRTHVVKRGSPLPQKAALG